MSFSCADGILLFYLISNTTGWLTYEFLKIIVDAITNIFFSAEYFANALELPTESRVSSCTVTSTGDDSSVLGRNTVSIGTTHTYRYCEGPRRCSLINRHGVTSQTVAYPRRGGLGFSTPPPPKFRSFDKVEPDCELSGKCLVFVFQHPN